MQLRLIRTQFKHISDHSDRSGILDLMKYINACLHGDRISIVAIVHDCHTVCLYDMTVTAHRLIGLNALPDLLQRKSEKESH